MTYLIDSNIFIYATNKKDKQAYQFLSELQTFAYAAITKIEVLGYHDLKEGDQHLLQTLFLMGRKILLTDAIEEQAIQLRQQHRIKLGDAIIAATALVENLTLVSRNVEDFKTVVGLFLLNPYDLPTSNSYS